MAIQLQHRFEVRAEDGVPPSRKKLSASQYHDGLHLALHVLWVGHDPQTIPLEYGRRGANEEERRVLYADPLASRVCLHAT
jgi:hypothetical protein